MARLRAIAYALRTPVRVIRAADIGVLILSEGTLPHAPSERAATFPSDDASVKTKQCQIRGGCADGPRRPTLGTLRRPADLFRLAPWTCGSHMSILVPNRLRAQFGASPCSDLSGPPPPPRPQQSRRRRRRARKTCAAHGVKRSDRRRSAEARRALRKGPVVRQPNAMSKRAPWEFRHI